MVHNMGEECECASVDVVELDAIEELRLAEADDLYEVGEKYGIDPWSAAYWVEQGVGPEDVFRLSLWDDQVEKLNGIDIKQGAAEFEAAWRALQAAFAKATTIGKSHLTLHVGHHFGDLAHRWDNEVEPIFFWVEGADPGSPAGEKVSLFELYLRAVRLIQTNDPSGCMHPGRDQIAGTAVSRD